MSAIKRLAGFVAALALALSAADGRTADGVLPIFPEFDEIPAELRMPRHARLEVDADGNYRVDGRLRHLFGMQVVNHPLADLSPTPGYPESLKWIYEKPLNYERAQRLGFDSLAVFTLPDFVPNRYRPDFRPPLLRQRNIELNAETWGSGLPTYVDFTCFPWTNGLLAEHKELKGTLPEAALNAFRDAPGNHWVPYNIFHPEGRDAYRAYWAEGAKFALRHKSPIVAYELFNEPAYDDTGPYNRRLFAEWLRERYADIDRLNARYGSGYASFEAVSHFRHATEKAGLFVDWSKFLEQGFVELCKIGRDTIRELDPGARLCVQPLGRHSYRVLPLTHVNPYEISRVLDAVTTPTGGSAKVSGLLTEAAAESVATPDSGRGEGFLSRHFIRAIADGKPIINSEAYTGSNRQETFNTVWRDLLWGSNATYLFEWAKRAWDFRPAGTEEGGRRVAEKYPWMILNPYAYPPEELTSFMEVKKEIARFAEFFAPRQRGIPREIALLISFPSERHGVATGHVAKNDIATFASALEFSHYPIDAILEEQLAEGRARRYRVLVASGVRNVYPGTVAELREFVDGGGTLILAREFMPFDEYGHAHNEWGDFFDGLEFKDNDNAATAEIAMDLHRAALLPGKIMGRNLRVITSAPGWETLARCENRPVLLRKKMGAGQVYLWTAAMQDYAAAAMLGGVLSQQDIRPVAELRRADEKDLAANVELHAARRGERLALFLFNHDLFAKAIRIKTLDNAPVYDLVNARVSPRSADGALVLLEPLSRAIVGVGRRGDFEKEFGPFAAQGEEEIFEARDAINLRLAGERARRAEDFLVYEPVAALTRTLDLRPLANRAFVDRVPGDGVGGWTDQGAENSLVGVPFGLQRFRGVPCDIIRFDENGDRTCVVLRSENQSGELPAEALGVPVNGRVKALYFFHAAAWSEKGKNALVYRLLRADGSRVEIPARCEEDIWDWWIKPGNPHVAWQNRSSRGFYLWRWENPEPEKEILSLDLVSADNSVVAMVVAITAEYFDEAREPLRLPLDLENARPFDTMTGQRDARRLEIVVSEKSHPWSGLTLPYAGPPLPGEPSGARLRFRVKGGRDRFGNPQGGQRLQLHFLRRDPTSGEARRLSRTANLEMFLVDAKTLDAERFIEVDVPLDALHWGQHNPTEINALTLQFRGNGQQSGIVIENPRFECRR